MFSVVYRRGIARECVEIDRFADAERNQRRAHDPSDLLRPWHSSTFQVMLTCSDRDRRFSCEHCFSPLLQYSVFR